MDTSAIISITGKFFGFVGEALADLKRQEVAKVDIELLEQKRNVLAEKLEEFKSNLDTLVKQEKARAEQDLTSRGLANLTVRQSNLAAIERDAATELERALREYNRAIEEIALMERRVEVQARRWWRRFFPTSTRSRGGEARPESSKGVGSLG